MEISHRDLQPGSNWEKKQEVKTHSDLKQLDDQVVAKKGKRDLNPTSMKIEFSSPEKVEVVPTSHTYCEVRRKTTEIWGTFSGTVRRASENGGDEQSGELEHLVFHMGGSCEALPTVDMMNRPLYVRRGRIHSLYSGKTS